MASENPHRVGMSLVKALPSNARGMGSIPGQGTKSPHATPYGQKLKKKKKKERKFHHPGSAEKVTMGLVGGSGAPVAEEGARRSFLGGRVCHSILEGDWLGQQGLKNS